MRYISEFIHISKIKLYDIITTVTGNKIYKYNDNIVNVLNNILKNNNMNMCTVEQENFYKQFFEEANKVTTNESPYINTELYNNMEQKFKDLDIYLGGIV